MSTTNQAESEQFEKIKTLIYPSSKEACQGLAREIVDLILSRRNEGKKTVLPKPEPLVVHRGEDNVTHARLHGHTAEKIGIELFGAEAGRQRLVFLTESLFDSSPFPARDRRESIEVILRAYIYR